MHPLEGLIYQTGALVPCFFKHHPALINFVKIENTLSAVLGHDGHDFPGSGDYWHMVHHIKINCNYGSRMAPFDWLFGSMERCEPEEFEE